jgi:hypothetical protein
VLNDDGAVHSQARYYPYGEERWRSGTLPTEYRFTGQRDLIGRGDGTRVGEYWHFTSLADAESRLQEAIEAKDATAFGRALHAYQDYWFHTRKGYTYLMNDAGEEALARLCPECRTMMGEDLLHERSRIWGHKGEKWNDEYTPTGPMGTVDMDDVWMTQGTEYWLILFFCEMYGIDPQDYWDLYGEIEKPHAYSHFDED